MRLLLFIIWCREKPPDYLDYLLNRALKLIIEINIVRNIVRDIVGRLSLDSHKVTPLNRLFIGQLVRLQYF